MYFGMSWLPCCDWLLRVGSCRVPLLPYGALVFNQRFVCWVQRVVEQMSVEFGGFCHLRSYASLVHYVISISKDLYRNHAVAAWLNVFVFVLRRVPEKSVSLLQLLDVLDANNILLQKRSWLLFVFPIHFELLLHVLFVVCLWPI